MSKRKRWPTKPIVVDESYELPGMADLADKAGVDRNTVYYWMSGRSSNHLTRAKRHGIITVRFKDDKHLAARNKRIVAGVKAKLDDIEARRIRNATLILMRFRNNPDKTETFTGNAAVGRRLRVSREIVRRWRRLGIPASYGVAYVDWNYLPASHGGTS